MLLNHCYCYPSSSLCCLFILLCSSLVSPSYARCVQSDHHSLLSSFSPPLNALLNWSSTDCCQWEGISCDPSGRVISLWLPSKGLDGGISSSITNLTHLSHLKLSHNSLVGSLPAGFFSSLNLLEVLDLSCNMLQGELPQFSSLSSVNQPFSIVTVDLSMNRFCGSISSSLFHKADNLEYFNVSHNFFTGTIPSSPCVESSSMRVLDFSFNGLTGQIPRGMDECSKLETLRMGFNNLSGTIPNEIYHIPTLREVNLASNWLQGSIDNGISNLTNLTILELHSNELSGRLPRDMGKLSKLERLVLEMNHFGGIIPASLMNCTQIRVLKCGFNGLEGDLSNQDFSKMLSLEILDLRQNLFTGKFPTSIYSCKSLRAIRLGSNRLDGQITSDMLSLQSLSFLSLAYNRLTNITGALRILTGCKELTILVLAYSFVGENMPDDMPDQNGFQNLKLLSFRGCRLNGQIPVWIKKLRNLQVLDLEDNQLSGTIPSWLGNLPQLFHINLPSNRITGAIPRTLYHLKALKSENFAPDNTILELPLFVTMSSYKNSRRQYNRLSDFPREINLQNNRLLSDIPDEIGCSKFLQSLDLSYNNLSGSIPNAISKLTGLERLILARNHLSGKIPEPLTSLNFLREFSVSFNNLEGPVPKGTQLQSFGASAYEGNAKLCGPPFPNQCQVNEHGNEIKEGEGEDDETGWLHYASMGLGFVIGFSTVCCTLMLIGSWRRACMSSP